MQNNEINKNENLPAQRVDPSVIYMGASKLKLTDEEMKALGAPFDDDVYEIKPDGYIYLPQYAGVKRLNDSVGIGNWTLNLVKESKEEIGPGQFKVYYDGFMMIRDCFVSRSVGESTYFKSNQNSSWASAFEAAKSDCRQRCCKDLGIANDAYNPAFMRRWKAKHAIRVWIDVENSNGGKDRKVVWRRKDVEPFWNEIGEVPTAPTVPSGRTNPNELPWLNVGPELDAVLREMEQGEATLGSIRATSFRISRDTEKAIISHLTKFWVNKTDEKMDVPALTLLYNEHKAWIDSHPFIKEIFTARRMILVKSKAKVA